MASGRRRLGVALVLDPPVADEVDGLRRALGDPSLGRIPSHITLVPPVNVRGGDVGAALARLRSAAHGQRAAMRLTLGTPASFLPANPVLYLPVGGEIERLRKLRDAVFVPPLERTLSWPWVPHVTLADGIPEEQIAAALAAVGKYAVVADFDRVVLLEEGRRRLWTPVADAALEAPSVVGQGGLALEMTRGRMLDPEVQLLVAGFPDEPHRPAARSQIVLTGRREGAAVGVAVAWAGNDGGHVSVYVAPDVRRQGIGGHLLMHVETAARRAGWGYRSLEAHGPEFFYRARSTWSVATRTRQLSTRPAS